MIKKWNDLYISLRSIAIQGDMTQYVLLFTHRLEEMNSDLSQVYLHVK